MTRLVRRAVVSCCIVLGACGGKDSPTTPPAPVPGDLTVSLSTSYSDDRALLFTLTGPGPITAVQSSSTAYYVQYRSSGASLRIAVFGHLVNGPVLRFSVPDVAKSSQYLATVQEAADPQNNLRTSTSGYAFSVSR